MFAVDALVLQNDVVAVAIDRLEVYPNGFTISLLMRVDPRRVRDMMEMLAPLGANRWPDVGVRFADGEPPDAGLVPAPFLIRQRTNMVFPLSPS